MYRVRLFSTKPRKELAQLTKRAHVYGDGEKVALKVRVLATIGEPGGGVGTWERNCLREYWPFPEHIGRFAVNHFAETFPAK